jgi:hypothetical protein
MMIYVRCLESSDTLRLEESAGNNFWTTRQIVAEACTEPWLVQAVKGSRPFFVQSTNDAALAIPACFAKTDTVQSIGFFPLYRAGMVGGGMLLASAEADFFTPIRQTLIEEYSYLLALAFNDSDFH